MSVLFAYKLNNLALGCSSGTKDVFVAPRSVVLQPRVQTHHCPDDLDQGDLHQLAAVPLRASRLLYASTAFPVRQSAG